MDILIIVDNISQNYKWCNTFNTIKRWIVYWFNNNLIKNNIKSITIAKTFPEPKIIRLDDDSLKLENIINIFDSIIVKKTQTYNCINIKHIFDICSKNIFIKSLESKKTIIENKKIIIEDNGEYKYSDIYVFSSILETKLTEDNIKYINDSLNNDNITNIKFVNFAYKKFLPTQPKIIEKIINQKHVDNYELYTQVSQLLNLKPESNDFNKNDSNISDTFEKLFEIEFVNYKKSHWSENPITKDIGDIYLNYIDVLNQNKNIQYENMSEPCINFIKYCINWIRIKLLEKFNNINFNIPVPKINQNLANECVLENIKFYELVYPKILSQHIGKLNKKYNFSLGKIKQIDLADIELKIFPNDDSTNYLYSNTTMTNWKQEYENLNPFGIILKYTPSNYSYRGLYDYDILTTYPNMMISSISNNWLSLFDYYQLVSADIDTSTKTKFSIGDYLFIDNLHGDSNIMLPIYINLDHWKLAKKYWSYHMSFINEAFEFDYVKKMDNIYFLTMFKTINIISNTKCNQNIIRLFIYILRTCIQICIDNKYSYNNKADYDKHFNTLLNSEDLQSFNKIFIDYLIRVIQTILTSNIQLQELSDNINKVILCYIEHLIKNEYCVEDLKKINAMNNEEKKRELEHLEEKINLNILCFLELKKDIEFFWNFMKKIYSIKKFNQLIKFLDKYNGCLPVLEEDLNCGIIEKIINCLINMQSNAVLNIKELIISTGLIKI